jgi:hypothetical protein
MRREQAGQLVSFLARQPGAYHGGSGRLKIGICHKAMITGRPPSAGDQHAAICPIRAHQTTRAHRPERQVTKYGCRIERANQSERRHWAPRHRPRQTKNKATECRILQRVALQVK